MVIKTLVISIILITIIILALGVKILLKKHGEFPAHSCALEEDGRLNKDEDCTQCDLKDLVNCPEKREK